MLKRKDSFFGLHFDLHPKAEDSNLGADVEENNIRKLLRRVRPDYVTYDCKGHEGYAGYDTSVGIAAPNIVRDSLRVWRDVTAEMDISLGIHYSGLQDFAQVRVHPEYGVQRPDGTTDGRTASVFSSYADDLLIPQLTEIVERYGVNGVWLDAECWGAQLDYVPKALAAWKEYSGGLPAPERKDSPTFETFKRFHREAFERYLRHWTGELARRFPEVDRCSNWAYTTMMPKAKDADVSMISGDFDPFLSLDRARTECRYLENTGLSWELQSWGFDMVEGQGPCRKMPAQIQQEAAVVLMHGGGYMNYFLPTRGGYIEENIISTLGEVADFVRARQEVSHRSRPLYEYAVLYPTASQLRRSDKVYAWWGDRLDEVEGVLHALLESGRCATVLAEHQLAAHLDQIKCLLIPECTVIEEQYLAQIKRYVERGGRLAVLGAEAAGMFADVLGVTPRETEETDAALSCADSKVPVNGVWRRVETAGATCVMKRFRGGGTLKNCEYVDVRERVAPETAALTQSHTAATVHNFGQGMACGFYADFGKRYFACHHPYLRSALDALLEALEVPTDIRVQAPPCVDISLRESAAGSVTVHLLNTLNMPVGGTRKFSSFVPEIGPVYIKVRCGYSPSAVRLVPEGRALPFEAADGWTKVCVDRLAIHSVVEFVKRGGEGKKIDDVETSALNL